MVPIVLTLKTDKKTYASHEPLQMTLLLKNTTQAPIRLDFSSGQRYDIELRREKGTKGELVWQWARERMFTMALGSVTLAPGKPQTYAETYTPKSANGQAASATMPTLSAGTYTLIATITTMGEKPRPTAQTTITIQ